MPPNRPRLRTSQISMTRIPSILLIGLIAVFLPLACSQEQPPADKAPASKPPAAAAPTAAPPQPAAPAPAAQPGAPPAAAPAQPAATPSTPAPTAVPAPEPAQPPPFVGKDGAAMVAVPAGDFLMGSEDAEPDEKPTRLVHIDAFYLDKLEVTNGLFEKFVQATKYKTTAEREGYAYGLNEKATLDQIKGMSWRNPPGIDKARFANYPVVAVSAEDAEAYCQWAGKRLPTEAEFEYAARAGTRTDYWWGNDNPAETAVMLRQQAVRRVANIADEQKRKQIPAPGRPWPIMSGYDDGFARTAPAGSYEPNAFGLYDMIGNVSEWTADWYGPYRRADPPKGEQAKPDVNPKGPPTGRQRVIRGGSWFDPPRSVRTGARNKDVSTYRDDSIGFRCAQDVKK
jgi:formylglycine-generating enzyme required for sulfatase activity